MRGLHEEHQDGLEQEEALQVQEVLEEDEGGGGEEEGAGGPEALLERNDGSTEKDSAHETKTYIS